MWNSKKKCQVNVVVEIPITSIDSYLVNKHSGTWLYH